MEVIDSRRLTGPTRFWNLPGAILDASAPEATEAEKRALINTWRIHAEHLLQAVGWQDQKTTSRIFQDGLSLVISAPMDALYAATELNEAAFQQALAELRAEPGAPPSDRDVQDTITRLRATIEEERNPELIKLQESAQARGVLFLADDDHVSIGAGKGSLTWPARELPAPSDIPWNTVHGAPIASCTGTNGKSTTVRLLATMAQAQGLVPGISSTDWIRVGDEVLDHGDYSGPGGARTLLRDPRVDIALLETARGGLNRRGLAVQALHVAAVTNIASDHLGEHGSYSLADLADVKFATTRVAHRVVLTYDDPILRAHGEEILKQRSDPTSVIWCGMDRDGFEAISAHTNAGGTACVLQDETLTILRPEGPLPVAALTEVPFTLEGAARHNTANALTAMGTAVALGFGVEAMRSGLRRFGLDPDDNPGRLNRFQFGGLDIVVDFAHNPEGLKAVLALPQALGKQRFLVVLSQAGDRSDEDILELARTLVPFAPDRILIKELTAYLRGRAPGEVPALLEQELLRLGVGSDAVLHVDSERAALVNALTWGGEDDLVLLLTHQDRDEVLAALGQLQHASWLPDQPLPGGFLKEPK